MYDIGIGRPLDDLMCNCIVKRYPDGSATVFAADRCIWRMPGFESLSDKKDSDEKLAELWDALDDMPDVERSQYQLARREAAEAERAARNLDRAKRRARSALRDLARANDFTHFVTLTLNAEKVDRYDMRSITKILNSWLDNRVRRDGLRYVLVPERHKDGAVHFHGFFNDALPLLDSGTVIPPEGGKPRKPRSKAQREAWLAAGGHAVYNLPAWTLGFTTAIELYGDRHAAIGYVAKYITKSQEKIGGRWYYSGGNLSRPAVEFCRCDFAQLSGLEGVQEFGLSDLNVKLLTLEAEGGEKSGV